HIVNRLAYGGHDRRRIPGIANHEIVQVLHILRVGQIIAGLLLFIQAVVFHVLSYSNDFNVAGALWPSAAIVFADWRSVWKHGARRGFTEDADLRRTGSVLRTKVATGQKGNPHRSEIARAYRVVVDVFVEMTSEVALHPNRVVPSPLIERKTTETGSAHSRKRIDARFNLLVEPEEVRVFPITGGTHIDV